jgi:hypothetical protein
MTFQRLAFTMALGCCLLGLRFLFAGASLLEEWGLAVSDAPLVITRRLGALYLGFAVLFFLGRAAPPSELRTAVCVGLGGGSALLAALGLYELQAGRVGTGIVVPSIIELALAGCFAWVAWTAKRTAP